MALSNCVNETLEALGEVEIQTRTGWTKEQLVVLHSDLSTLLDTPSNPDETVEVFHDGSATTLRAVSSYGDPLDLGEGEVETVLAQLSECLKKEHAG